MNSVFLILSMLFLQQCSMKGENEIYILPKNFNGFVVVFWNQKSGDSLMYYNSSRVYHIKPSGFLLTRFKQQTERRNMPEFYFDSISDNNRIPVAILSDSLKPSITYATLISNYQYSRSNDNAYELSYSAFFVGMPGNIDKYQEDLSRLEIDELYKRARGEE